MRQPTMYMAPFRIRHADDMNANPSYGAAFTPDMVGLPEGPLYGQVPGGITRWMAVPWQADTASCRSGYPSKPPVYAPHLPTFWPARLRTLFYSLAGSSRWLTAQRTRTARHIPTGTT